MKCYIKTKTRILKMSFIIAPLLSHRPSYRFSQSFLCQFSFPAVFVCVCVLCVCCWPCSRACGLCASLRLCGTSPAGLRLGGVPGLNPVRARTSGRLHPVYGRRHTHTHRHARYNSNPMVWGGRGNQNTKSGKNTFANSVFDNTAM